MASMVSNDWYCYPHRQWQFNIIEGKKIGNIIVILIIPDDQEPHRILTV